MYYTKIFSPLLFLSLLLAQSAYACRIRRLKFLPNFAESSKGRQMLKQAQKKVVSQPYHRLLPSHLTKHINSYLCNGWRSSQPAWVHEAAFMSGLYLGDIKDALLLSEKAPDPNKNIC